MKLTHESLLRIFNALKEAGHWYNVEVKHWKLPLNKTPSCVAILFDGSLNVKFELINNGRLKVVYLHDGPFYTFKPSLVNRVGVVFSITEVVNLIKKSPHKIKGFHEGIIIKG